MATSSKYTTADLLSDLSGVKRLEERIIDLCSDGPSRKQLRELELASQQEDSTDLLRWQVDHYAKLYPDGPRRKHFRGLESASQQQVMKLLGERAEILASIENESGVKQIALFHQHQRDNTDLSGWLEVQIEKLRVQLGCDGDEKITVMSPKEFGESLLSNLLVELPVSNPLDSDNPPEQIAEALAGRNTWEIYDYLLREFRREHALPYARYEGANEQVVSDTKRLSVNSGFETAESLCGDRISLLLFDKWMFQLERLLVPEEILYCESKLVDQKQASIGDSSDSFSDELRVVCKQCDRYLPGLVPVEPVRDATVIWGIFSVLATLAGSHLSTMFRESVPGLGDDPLTNWLQLMFCTLELETNRNLLGYRYELSCRPFADAANVIKQCRLNTNEPILPPLLRARTKRIDVIPKAPLKAKKEPTIEEIDDDTPALEKDSSDWIRANDPQMRKEAAVKSLKTMRNDKSARKNSEGTFGIDKVGRRWRKESKDAKTVYYWRSTLKSDLAA